MSAFLASLLDVWFINYLLCRDNYPYYKPDDDRWKNSVRHNLSMNPNFRKGGRAKQGTGHVWVLADVGTRQVSSSSRPNQPRLGWFDDDGPLQEPPPAPGPPGPRTTADDAIRKILQSSYPGPGPGGEKTPASRRRAAAPAPVQAVPVAPAAVRAVPTPSPACQYSEVYPGTVQYPAQYTAPLPVSDFSLSQFDYSVSDSDRLVRALGLDFSEPGVQRELSAK